jgi:predicted Zn-dependent peptidase
MGKSQTEIADKLGALGANLTTSGESDYSGIGLSVPGPNARPALELLADVVTGPTFPVTEIEKVRQDLLAEIRTVPDRPFENTNQAFYSRLYRRSPYRNPVIGTEKSVGSLTEAQIRDFYKDNMVGSNLVVVVVGPVSTDMIGTWAAQRFGRLSPGTPARVGGTKDVAPVALTDTLIVRDQEQTTYNTGWPAVAIGDPDYIPLRVAVGVLSDRFFFKYVYDKGIAYRSWFYMARKVGQASVQNEMGVSPAAYRPTSAEVLSDVARFVREPIPAADFEAAKRKLISRYYLGTQTSDALAAELGFWEISGLGLDAYAAYPERIRRVTADQASRAARKYLLPERYVKVAIGKS